MASLLKPLSSTLAAVSRFITEGNVGSKTPPDPNDTALENDGTMAPLDGDRQDTLYGVNFEDLNERDPEAVEALRQIIFKRERDQIATRQGVLRRCAASRLYVDGIQDLIWDENEGTFTAVGPNGAVATNSDDDEVISSSDTDDAMSVMNVVRPHGSSIGATLLSQIPKTRFWPADTNRKESVQAAEEASYIAKYIQRNNKISALQRQWMFHMLTDGAAFGYVRYVTDAQRFGYREIPVRGPKMIETEPEGYYCTNCKTPSPTLPPMGQPCPVCQAPPPGDGSPGFEFQPAQQEMVPDFPLASMKVPAGQEVIGIEGHLEVEVPYAADSVGGDMSELSWLFYKKEFDRSAVKAAFPDKADELTESSDPLEASERQARLGPKEAGYLSWNADNRKELLTVRRCWLRPSNFWMDIVDDNEDGPNGSVRDRLLGYFPDGCYVAFAGDTFLEARSEAMERKWRMMFAHAGKGLNRSGLLQDLLGAQDIINSIWNIRMDAAEKGIPFRLYNSGMLSEEAIKALDSPGSSIPAKTGPGPNETLEQAIKQTDQVEVPGLKELLEDAMAAAELLSGDYAALQGAPESTIDTASGYSMAINQAKGRFGPVWAEEQRFFDELNFIAVECFLEHRPDVETISLEDRNGKPISKEILCNEIAGQFDVYPESDPDIPSTYAETGAKMAAMVQSQNPAVQAVVSHPANAAEFRKFIGNDNLVMPGEYDYENQMEEIDEMLQAQPAPTMGDPIGGQPPGLASSIPINPLLDNHSIHLEAIKLWSQSPEGREAAKENPVGFSNVMMHAQAHEAQIQQAMMQQAMMAAGPPGQPGPPGKGGSDAAS